MTKSWSFPPLLCLKKFDTRILSKRRKVLLRILSAQWDKEFSTEFSDIPFLCIKISIPEFLWYTEVFPNVTFWYCGTKNLNEKSWYPLLCIKFFDTPNFLKHWSDAHEFFWHCEIKNSRWKNVITPIKHKIFGYPKISETLKWCPSNFFALWDRNLSPENRDITPFLSIEDFSFQKFSKTKNGSPAKFSRSCEKINFDKIVKLPTSFAWKSSIPESFRNTEGFFYELYRHSETKNFQRSSVISPFYA